MMVNLQHSEWCVWGGLFIATEEEDKDERQQKYAHKVIAGISWRPLWRSTIAGLYFWVMK